MRDIYIKAYANKILNAYEQHGSLIIGYDFDDTVMSEHPVSKYYVHLVRMMLRKLAETGCCRFILITCREGERLKEAEEFLQVAKLPYNAINQNLPNSITGDPRKIYCNIMIDDKAGIYDTLAILELVYNKLPHIKSINRVIQPV